MRQDTHTDKGSRQEKHGDNGNSSHVGALMHGLLAHFLTPARALLSRQIEELSNILVSGTLRTKNITH